MLSGWRDAQRVAECAASDGACGADACGRGHRHGKPNSRTLYPGFVWVRVICTWQNTHS